MITQATQKLLDWIEEMRGTEWRDQMQAALAAAANSGWDWRKAHAAAARLALRDESSPAELTDAAADPKRKDGYVPGAAQRGRRLARELVAAKETDS